MRPRGGRREGAGRPKVPLLPFRAALVELPRAVPVGSIEELLVRQAARHVYREPVTFRSWLEARADEDSPTGDLARDLAAVSSPWASALDIKRIVCPEGEYAVDEGTGKTDPCPTTDKHHLDHLIDAAEREFLAQTNRP